MGVPLNLPLLPKSAMEHEFKLDLYLTDAPGQNGHALAHTSWQIVRPRHVENLTAGLVNADDVLAAGVSNETGQVKFTAEQEKIISEEFCKRPGNIWIVYVGHVIRLDLEPENPAWSDDDKHLRALNALDFSDAQHIVKSMGSEPQDSPRAKRDLKAIGAALYQKLKGGK